MIQGLAFVQFNAAPNPTRVKMSFAEVTQKSGQFESGAAGVGVYDDSAADTR